MVISSNITVERAGKKITTKLNKDITVDSVKANNKVSVGATTKTACIRWYNRCNDGWYWH